MTFTRMISVTSLARQLVAQQQQRKDMLFVTIRLFAQACARAVAARPPT